MRHATSLTLNAYWDSLRAGRSAPRRDEVDPAAIRGVLASVFVLELPPSGDAAQAVFRLSGTRADALFGRPLRGTAFHRIWSARCAAPAAAALASALGPTRGLTQGATPGLAPSSSCAPPDGARPVVVAARGGPPGRDAVDLELLLLPLDDGAGRDGGPGRLWARCAIGSLAAFTAPNWMGLAAAAPLDLVFESPPAPGRVVFGRRGPALALHPGGRGDGRGGSTPSAARP